MNLTTTGATTCTTAPVTGLQVTPKVLKFISGAPSDFTVCTQYPSSYSIKPTTDGIVSVSASHVAAVKDPVTGIYNARISVSALLPGTVTIRVSDTKWQTYVTVYVTKLNRQQLYAVVFQPRPYAQTVNAYAANSLGSTGPFGQVAGLFGGGAIGVDPVSRLYAADTNIPTALHVYASICAPLLHLGDLQMPEPRPIGAVAIGPNGDIFVRTTNYQQTPQYTYVFPAGSVGNVKPIRSLYIPQAINMDVDSKGFLYILPGTPSYDADHILIYGPTASGAALPVRTIVRNRPDMTDVKVDSGGRIYVSGYSGGTVYAPNASGYATPIVQIPGRNGHGYSSVAVSPSGTIYFGVRTVEFSPMPAAEIDEYRLANVPGGYQFLGTLHTVIPESEAYHMVIGP